ncbi:MAG: UDP-N-acetylglucosamine 2-epimerase (hydrolyzing) [Thermosipho sp. (in: Bacteria)]|nr:UDP-N-acetylglucosamine 2-epimerase (hydrolyzing) [Thermosipho sp. (in: thermotogales)]
MNKKIVYITGARSDFGRMKYILNAIENHPKFSLYLIVTGMHLSKEFGYTVNEIKEKFPKTPIFIADSLLSSDTLGAMAKSLGISVYAITQHLEIINPDAVIILGDRWESLAGAIAARMLNIKVFHIGGGYKSGSIDDRIRDAITVFSDVHLVANKNCAERVISIGANPRDVYVVGAPDLEAIVRKDFTQKEELIKKCNINEDEPLILAIYHPDTNEYFSLENQVINFLEAIIEVGFQTILIYPNADAGGRDIIELINRIVKNNKKIKIFTNIKYEDFLGLMNIANVIVGNSSAGIIEAPSFGLPAVNIGNRQKNRERGENVIDVGYDKNEIVKAILKAITDIEFIERAKSGKNPYGDGKTSKRVIEILEKYLTD